MPDFTDEAFPFRRAFEMAGWQTGRAQWNPGAFHYPSLAFYLFLGVQEAQFLIGRWLGLYRSPADFFVSFEVDPTPAVMVGRLVGALCQLATVAGAAVIGERVRRGAGLLAGFLLAVSPMMLLATRGIGVDAPMTALSVWAFERMLAYRDTGRTGTLVASAVLIGLAAGTKYPAGLLVVPLAWAVAAPSRALWPRRWLAAAAGAFAVFLATSPFLPFELTHVRSDAQKIANLLGAGQLGSPEQAGVGFYLAALAAEIGPVGVALLAAGLLLALDRRRQGVPWAGLWLFFLAFAGPPLFGRAGLARYLVPALPGAALLAALAAGPVVERAPGRARRWVGAMLVVALVLPPALAGLRVAATGRDTTQSQAGRWLEARLPDTVLVVQETYGAALRSCPEMARILRSPAYAASDPRWRARLDQRRTMHVVTLPLVVAGRAAVAVPVNQRVRYVELWPSSAQVNTVFYAPALFGAVDYVVTSSAVRGRYSARPDRYLAPVRFYRWLDHAAEPVARFVAGGGVTGPEIRVYHLGARARRGARAKAFDPLWWARAVPTEARRALGAAVAPDLAPAVEVRDSSGHPAPWVRALAGMFDHQIAPYAYAMAGHLVELERLDDARGFATAILASGEPGSEWSQRARALIVRLSAPGATSAPPAAVRPR
ncbi:MAG TPA: glycosyltransferase family 39 protein [Candidatus Eisenbacteria bacterium]